MATGTFGITDRLLELAGGDDRVRKSKIEKIDLDFKRGAFSIIGY
jgi:hypothetical protein